MGRPTKLTRDDLQRMGVKLITQDGRVFMSDDSERAIQIMQKASKWDVQYYRAFQLYDHEYYEARKDKVKYAPGLRTIILSRAIWAWYKGECPANMDVDHIDNDSMHDELSNYQLLTRKQNLAKRKGHRNQYAASEVK